VASEGMQALLGFSQRAADLEKHDQPSLEPRQRITIGLYFYTEPTSPPTPRP
jgi:hypothetical protein